MRWGKVWLLTYLASNNHMRFRGDNKAMSVVNAIIVVILVVLGFRGRESV